MAMEITRTIKLKIDLPVSVALRTIQEWNQACNYISQVCFRHPSLAHNKVKIQELLYYDVRSLFDLSAQVTVSAIRHVTAKYQALKTSKIRPKQALYFKPHTAIVLQGGERGRDFGFRQASLSLWTINGRRKDVTYDSAPALANYLQHWQLGDARMFVSKESVYLSVSFSRQVELVSKPDNAVIGVDRGIIYLAVATDGQRSQFFGGQRVTHKRNRYLKTRASLQRKKAMKNTRSVRRALKRLRGKEAKFMRDVNHVVSRRIVDFATTTGNPTIAIEKLDGIRQSPRRKEQNGQAHSWSFYQLEQFLQYKAVELGFEIIEIDPAYTSKCCSKCGHTARSNRQGQRFLCQACGYSLHADLNAARNIKLRGILARQALSQDGLSSVSPKARVSINTTGKLTSLGVGN